MSQENADSFLEGAEVINRGDIAVALEGYDEAVVFEPQAAEMEGAFVGPDGVREFFAGLADVYEVFRIHFSEIRDLGDQVLALGTMTPVSKGSGIEQETPLAIVARYRNGLITQFKDYGNRDEALEAAGLRE